MARESTQHKLDRVRSPRVQITYDVEVGGAIELKELPFVVGVLGDFTGQPEQPTESQSFRHICLEVDDIQAMVYQLKKKDIEVSDPKLGMDHSWQAWVADPDGNKIELHDYTPESWQAPFLK